MRWCAGRAGAGGSPLEGLDLGQMMQQMMPLMGQVGSPSQWAPLTQAAACSGTTAGSGSAHCACAAAWQQLSLGLAVYGV